MASLKKFKSVLSFIKLTSFLLLFAGSCYVFHMSRISSYTINNRSIPFGAINTGGNLHSMTDAMELQSNKEVLFKDYGELWSTKADIQQPVTDTEDFISRVTKFLGELPHVSVYREGLESVIKRAKARRPGWECQGNQSALDTQFLLYMKCPTSLRWKLLLDPFTQRKFLPETPILAWDKHYSDKEYSRLSEYHRVNGWLSMDKKHVSSALAALNSSHNAYLFDDRLANEASPVDGRCITCAVVGNGGVLNGSKMGKEIDAHDYVFRVNTALTNGHEDDVGTRTSFYFFGMVTLSRALRHGQTTGFTYPPGDKGVRYVFLADRESAYSYIAAVLNGQDPPPSAKGRRMIRFPKPLQTDDIKLIHPDFERYLKWSWVNSTNQENFLHRPTTGGVMLLLALHTCDELDVYGFGGSYDKYSEHYYDNVYKRHVAIPHHDNHAENTLWKELHSRRIITLYTRD